MDTAEIHFYLIYNCWVCIKIRRMDYYCTGNLSYRHEPRKTNVSYFQVDKDYPFTFCSSIIPRYRIFIETKNLGTIDPYINRNESQ
jgi:hypothetical protein